MAMDKKKTNNEITPLVKSLIDSFKIPTNLDYKKELLSALSKKYLGKS
jgi:hypothetical protein